MSRQLILVFFCIQFLIAVSGQTSGQISEVNLSVQDARIAFITSGGNLATIDADGSDLQVLSEDLISYQFPVWSPDGSSIAAIGNDGSQGLIDVFSDEAWDSGSDSSRVFSSTQELPFYMYWSPDAKTISFLANTPESGLAMNFVDVERQTSRARALGNPFYWQWTADSSKVLIHQGIINGQLGFLDAEGDETLDENLAESGFFRSPGISPSGDYIAYSESSTRGTEIILKNNPVSTNDDVAEVSRALPHKGFTAMSWSPAQDQLAFILPKQESMNSFGDLAMMDAETGLLETLTEESVIAFFWSPDGQYIMYLTPQRAEGNDFANHLDTYRSASGDTLLTQVSESYLAQGNDIELAVNIVEASTGEVTYLTSIRPTRNFINQFVPFFDQYALSHNVWSGDSQAIVLPTRDEEGISNIAVIYIEDGDLDVIAEGSTPFWQH